MSRDADIIRAMGLAEYIRRIPPQQAECPWCGEARDLIYAFGTKVCRPCAAEEDERRDRESEDAPDPNVEPFERPDVDLSGVPGHLVNRRSAL